MNAGEQDKPWIMQTVDLWNGISTFGQISCGCAWTLMSICRTDTWEALALFSLPRSRCSPILSSPSSPGVSRAELPADWEMEQMPEETSVETVETVDLGAVPLPLSEMDEELSYLFEVSQVSQVSQKVPTWLRQTPPAPKQSHRTVDTSQAERPCIPQRPESRQSPLCLPSIIMFSFLFLIVWAVEAEVPRSTPEGMIHNPLTCLKLQHPGTNYIREILKPHSGCEVSRHLGEGKSANQRVWCQINHVGFLIPRNCRTFCVWEIFMKSVLKLLKRLLICLFV